MTAWHEYPKEKPPEKDTYLDIEYLRGCIPLNPITNDTSHVAVGDY